MKRREFLSLCLMVGAGFRFSSALAADAYPNRPIKLIVPFAPGGSTDVIARMIAGPLGQQLGQTIVVDNKGGAGGIIGTTEVLRSTPDGYTLLLVSPSITAANPAINPAARYNPETDLTAIINLAASPMVLAVTPNFPAKDFSGFIAAIKKEPDRYTYESPGMGGIIHLQMELLKSLTGTSIKHVPFRGAGQGLLAVVSGQVDIALDTLPSLNPFLKDRRVVPIAVAAPERTKELPQVPTFKELGLEPVNRMGYFGIVGPKGLPKDVVEKINSASRKALENPPTRKQIEDSGAIIVASTPEQFAAEIKDLHQQLKKLVVERKLTLE